MRTPLSLLVLGLTFGALACGGSETDEGPSEAAPDTVETADHDHEEIPDRSAEVARDEGSRPQVVMDFVGVEPGDRVVDVFAGSGYYTWLLSERVGPDGRVYAQGYSPGLMARVARGDLAEATNVTLVDSLSDLPADGVDHVLIIRGYHLFEDPAGLFEALHRALVPGGTIGVVELRLGADHGHDMETHRMGDRTVIDEFTSAGFELVESSDALRNPEDDHTGFWEGRRHLADRMLLKFAEPDRDSAGR
ncbi:MAG TPA: methyltransferase domain-containing protein [Gemmatimonadota bacterium]|nr:methyltransferase domain-containing protein [Gemmatimonadota bacterium]